MLNVKKICILTCFTGFLTAYLLNAAVTVTAIRSFSSATYLPGQIIDVTLEIGISGSPLPSV